MFCPKCGTQCADNTKFCISCGNPLPNAAQAAPQAPVAPKKPAIPFDTILKKNMHFINMGIAAVALIMFVLHTFGLFRVYLSPIIGETKGAFAADVISDLDGIGAMLLGNILFGLGNLLIAALATFAFLKACCNVKLYDMLYAKFVKITPLFLIGCVGAGTALIEIICCFASGNVLYSVIPNWTTWVMLLVYGGMIPVDLVILNKGKVFKPEA